MYYSAEIVQTENPIENFEEFQQVLLGHLANKNLQLCPRCWSFLYQKLVTAAKKFFYDKEEIKDQVQDALTFVYSYVLPKYNPAKAAFSTLFYLSVNRRFALIRKNAIEKNVKIVARITGSRSPDGEETPGFISDCADVATIKFEGRINDEFIKYIKNRLKTELQIRVFDLAVEGKSAEEIAEELGYVRPYISGIMRSIRAIVYDHKRDDQH